VKKPSNLRIFIDRNPFIHFLVVRLLRFQGRYSSCIFCKIVQGGAPERVLYQDELVTAFRDAHPAASTHILIVPNRHIESLNDLEPTDELLGGHLILIARKLAWQENLEPGKYSIAINTGLYAGQTVFHLHLHLKSGGF
jgi:histidine triad (HIT) family protein